MSTSSTFAVLDEARSRSDTLAERLRSHVERLQVAGERLAETVERLQGLEQETVVQLGVAKQRILAAQQQSEAGAKTVVQTVNDAHGRLDGLAARLSELEIGTEAAQTKDQIAGQFAELEESASSAAGAIEQVHDTLSESRASVEEAADELADTVQESSETAAHAAEALKAALDAALDQATHSIGDAVGSFLTNGADFRGSVDQILTSTVQAGLRELGTRSREYVEQAIRAKVKEVVRELVRSLLEALKSFRSQGSDIGLFSSESDAKFGRMDRVHASAAASADHVHAEKERLEQAKRDSEDDS